MNDRSNRSLNKILSKKTLLVSIVVTAFVLGFLVRGGDSGGGAVSMDESHEGHDHEEAPTEWTCSMHPQIRQPKPGLCPICAMDLIPASSQSSEMGMRTISVSPAAAALMQIETSPVERRFVDATVRMVGKITYDETRLKYITAWVGGRLDRLFVDYTGVAVNEGDHMVELYSPELLEAQEVLIQARRAVGQLERSNIGSVKKATSATLVAARERLLLWGLSEEQVKEIEMRGTASDRVVINAPMGGVVVHKNAQEGMYVQTGTQIYTIADLSRLWVEFDAYESDLAWLRYGQSVEFSAEAFPGETFTGTVAFINPLLDNKRRTVSVRVNVENANGRLRPGMFVRGEVRARLALGGKVVAPDLAGRWISPMHPEIIKDEPGNCDVCGMPLVKAEDLGFVDSNNAAAERPLVVPATAVLRTGTRAIVYVQLPDAEEPTFEGREVVLGPRAGAYYIIMSNLAEGEIVVTHGNFKIDSALQLSAKPSMMTPEGGGGGGGHNHGDSPAPAKDEPDTASMSGMEISETFRGQWSGVESAYMRLEQATHADELEAIRNRFTAMGRALALVDMHSLEGDAHNRWMESSMKMRNDVVEGKRAQDLDTARLAFGLLQGNVSLLRMHFGIQAPEGHDMSLADIPTEVIAQMTQVTLAYFAVPKALATDSLEDTQKKLPALKKQLESIHASLLAGDASEVLAKSRNGMLASVAAMESAVDLESVREALAPLSEELASTLRTFGESIETPVYRARCPMAFQNRGATWLQRDETINNPYFGAMMLRCGSVLEVLSEGEPSSADHGGHNHE